MGQPHPQTTDSSQASTGPTGQETGGQTGHGNAAALADMADATTGVTVSREGQPDT